MFPRFKYSCTPEVQVTLYAALTVYSTLVKVEKQEDRTEGRILVKPNME